MASYLTPTIASLARFSPHLLPMKKSVLPVKSIRQLDSGNSELETRLLQEIKELESDLQSLSRDHEYSGDLEITAVIDELLRSNEEFLNNSREKAFGDPESPIPSALPDLSSIIEANLDALTHCTFVNSSVRVEPGSEQGTTSTRYDIHGFCYSRSLQFRITMFVEKQRVILLDIHATNALHTELDEFFERSKRDCNIGNLLYGLSSFSRLCANRSLVFHKTFEKYKDKFAISSRESSKPSKTPNTTHTLSSWSDKTHLHIFNVTELVITWHIYIDETTGDARDVLNAGLRVPLGQRQRLAHRHIIRAIPSVFRKMVRIQGPEKAIEMLIATVMFNRFSRLSRTDTPKLGNTRQTSFSIAYETKKLLSRNKHEEALNLVRRACRETSCTVSWNLLIRDTCSVNRAFDYFNEMKKRAQSPNAQTYTILFDCLAKSPKSSKRALQLFHSIKLKSGVQTAVQHANACMKACSYANNFEAITSIFSQMPAGGPQSPNEITYTTYLIALLRADEIDVEIRVREAYEIWKTILHRWHKGHIRVDEALIFTLGKLMTISRRPSDWEFALQLVNVTFGLGHINPKSSTSFAVPNTIEPGNQILDLIFELCRLMQRKELAMEYWEALQNRIDVDLANYEHFLRLIMLQRSPEKAAAILHELIKRGIKPTAKTVFLALQACHNTKGPEIAMGIWETAKQENITLTAQLYFTFAKILMQKKSIHPLALNLFDQSWQHLKLLSKTCGDVDYKRLMEFARICNLALQGKNGVKYRNLRHILEVCLINKRN